MTRFFIIISIFALIIAGCGGGEAVQAEHGDIVKVHYTGTLDDGSQFDSSIGKDPLEFTIGAGRVIPGFEEAVKGMSVGEEKTVILSPEEGYGEHNPNLVLELPQNLLPEGSDPQVGKTINNQYPIIAVSETTFTIDKNPRLAGEYLTFEIELMEIAGHEDITITPTPTPQEGPSTYIATINTSLGNITVELYRDKLPTTVDNFVRLAEDGFYDGMIFHRIKDDFMLQTGKEMVDGTNKTSPYGFIDFEAHPDVRHVDGAISMARSDDPNSASAEFFICDGAQIMLDDEVNKLLGLRGWTAFGVVVDGIDIVREIASMPNDGRYEPQPGGGKPVDPVIIYSIEIEEAF